MGGWDSDWSATISLTVRWFATTSKREPCHVYPAPDPCYMNHVTPSLMASQLGALWFSGGPPLAHLARWNTSDFLTLVRG